MDLIEATFEDGVLRPLRRLALRPGEHVGIVVVRRPDPARWDLKRLAGGSSEEQTLAESGLDAWESALDREDRG
jgi:predicted DNA-binding antitoxin AbrB/MazE fold protein